MKYVIGFFEWCAILILFYSILAIIGMAISGVVGGLFDAIHRL